MDAKTPLLALLMLSTLACAGTFLTPVREYLPESQVVRIPIGTMWADVRAYQFNITEGYANCTGVNASRTCGPCPEPSEAVKFIVTYWNFTEVTTPFINQSTDYTSAGLFKIHIVRINETNTVESVGSGYCVYSNADATLDFYAFVGCASDSDCPSGYGCQNATYECVTSECNTNNDCAEDERCYGHQCASIPHGACGEVRNHTWVAYACCSDSDCKTGERCISNTCRTYRYCSFQDDCRADEHCSNETGHCEPLSNTTSCGSFIAHQWVSYACCADSDCPAGSRCANHACIGCTSDSNCPGDSACVNSACQKLTGCGLIANHTITRYQCCADSECFDEFACVEHACRPVSCTCGNIINHTCIACTPTPTPAATPTPAPVSPTPTPAPRPPAPCPVLFILAGLGLLLLAKNAA